MKGDASLAQTANVGSLGSGLYARNPHLGVRLYFSRIIGLAGNICRQGPAHMEESRGYSELLALTYDAATDPQSWGRVMNLLRDRTGTVTSSFNQHDYRRNRHTVLEMYPDDPTVRQSYAEHYGALSPWGRPLLAKHSGWVGLGSDLIPDSKLRRTEYFNDFLEKLYLSQLLAVQVVNDNETVATLCFLRGGSSESFECDHFALLRSLAPHFLRALTIGNRLGVLEARTRSLEQLLTESGSAVVLLDGVGRAILCSESAEQIIRDGVLRRRRERIEIADARLDCQFQALIRAACATGSGRGAEHGGGLTVFRPGHGSLYLLVIPMHTEAIASPLRPAAILFIRDPAREAVVPDNLLRDLFGLTKAESRLAAVLASGLELREAAEQSGVRYETARSNLKRIFEKTSTSRQVDLMLVLSTIFANLPGN